VGRAHVSFLAVLYAVIFMQNLKTLYIFGRNGNANNRRKQARQKTTPRFDRKPYIFLSLSGRLKFQRHRIIYSLLFLIPSIEKNLQAQSNTDKRLRKICPNPPT
jgi:hypothetical protein